ncbi:Long-chain fatty acid transport protein 1 [Melipona quadrifasciata]|uniref:Long-chain-fatty-acid--CoA ligase n=1 Tax=Melipona quadrifasciata TaxID=166423 RepID=A0A0M8ZZX8_9HYME|nr:Long-chain fatty acid transport protein 1 [Melipona quadrifasciata]
MGIYEMVIAAISVFIGAYLLTGKQRRFIYLLYKTLPRDVLGAYRFVRVNVLLWWWEWRKFTVAKLFTRHATANPDKIAFIFEDKEWSYRELEEYSNRLGRYFHGKSLCREDTIGLILESRPEYVGIWLGLSKAGLVGALLNTNLRQDVLVHSIKAANCKAVIFGSSFKDAINEIRERIPHVALYQWSELSSTSCLEGAIDLNPEISNVDISPLDTVAFGSQTIKTSFDLFLTSTIYCMRKYWSQVAQYIGEICRYLLTAPPAPCDTTHKVRLMFGNGLRPQIWKPFVERFDVKQIGEFYGATEGNSNLVNIDNKIGAVGFVPLCAGSLYPVALLRVDEETGEPMRGPDGLCIRCKPGELGVFVGKINPKRVLNDFSGYVDRKASEQKILRDVFRKGDRVFNSGDILLMDEFGWHGENVATSEVEAVVSNLIGLKDAAVYGVEVPGTEGKAGMAAIYDPENTLNIKEMADGLKKSLPSYARPLFIRVLSELPMTGKYFNEFIYLSTFKLKKKDLQEDGFNIKKVTDPIYFLDNSGVYVNLSEQIYNNILEGKVRL